jgi:UDP-N-acetylglucosamine 2-epimerase (non-hydrolysing)
VTHSSVKVMCIVGARPNFMKPAPVIEALERRKWATVTGQHYSREMSGLFFDALAAFPHRRSIYKWGPALTVNSRAIS